MEDDVHNYRTVCSTCLSGDRDLISIIEMPNVYQIFRLLMQDYPVEQFVDPLSDPDLMLCWECLALMKKIGRFKKQVHNAQEHLRILAMSEGQENLGPTYITASLSSLEAMSKLDYDRIYVDYSTVWPQHYIITEPSVKNEQIRDAIGLEIVDDVDDHHILEMPDLVLENPSTGVMSHIVVSSESNLLLPPYPVVKGEQPTLELQISPIENNKLETVIIAKKEPVDQPERKCGYTTDMMTEQEMLDHREQEKKKAQYASAVYKCELCIKGFFTQHQVEEHFISVHRAKPNQAACPICYTFIEDKRYQPHVDSHYTRYTCKICGDHAYTGLAITNHVKDKHFTNRNDKPVKRRSKHTLSIKTAKPGDLRKLLSKTTIEGYQCLECDMFFRSSRARKTHVSRYHREGLQCDHCKKTFVNKTTLSTHMKLHEGPLPREECPICHKMVRAIQLKYHIQRHQNKTRYDCIECNKTFSHLATYQAHLKYSRAHATDEVFKFPCPMCNKGYPSKEAMQDHFNYQHLGKTAHKCPVCDKPIASRANVEKHMMRVHGEKKEKPRNHVCQQCGKAFTDRKALTQHIVIHSGDRPLTCDICHMTFKQKASLYTHKKRVHKVYPPKKNVQFMDG